MLYSEHGRESVERYVSRVLGFDQGEIICDAPTAEALGDPGVREFVIGEEDHRTRTEAANGAANGGGDDNA